VDGIASRITAILLGIGLAAGVVAQDDTVYGWQLMSQQERIEYRTKMQSLKTEQEREAFRIQHHEQMKERAKAQGVTVPEEPMPRRQNRSPGDGPGRGPGR
jgi:hypothetical protein